MASKASVNILYSVVGRLTRIRTVPQRVLIRESPRARFDSQATSHPQSALAYPSRKRAITLAANGLPPPQLPAADSSNPVLLEMRKGVLLDVGNVLTQFSKMDRMIRAFCEQSSDYIGKSKRLPRITHQSALPKNSPMGKPAYEFTSTEDYVFFVLLSIINTHLYDDIFRPFHPAASARDSDRYEQEYLKMIDKCRLVPYCSFFRCLNFQIISFATGFGSVEIPSVFIHRQAGERRWSCKTDPRIRWRHCWEFDRGSRTVDRTNAYSRFFYARPRIYIENRLRLESHRKKRHIEI
jgi:hypothetical protein